MSLFTKLFNRTEEKESAAILETESNLGQAVPAMPQGTQEDPEELIAVLAAAIAAYTGHSADQIIVRNILRIPDGIPPWARAGLADQMHMRRSH